MLHRKKGTNGHATIVSKFMDYTAQIRWLLASRPTLKYPCRPKTPGMLGLGPCGVGFTGLAR